MIQRQIKRKHGDHFRVTLIKVQRHRRKVKIECVYRYLLIDKGQVVHNDHVRAKSTPDNHSSQRFMVKRYCVLWS